MDFYNTDDSILYSDNTDELVTSWEVSQEERCELIKITEKNNYYPEQFKSLPKNKRPKELFCIGNLLLLKKQAIMVCGARNASKTGLELAYKCGRLIAEQEFTLASGYARGVDTAAHIGALEAGGDTVAILPYGLLNFRLNHEVINSFDSERFLALSIFPLSYPFTARNAFRRNKLLVALSKAVIVVEPGETGGTWYSAQYASNTGKPLYFLEGERPGIIHKLEEMGGKRIEVNNGAPELGIVYEKE